MKLEIQGLDISKVLGEEAGKKLIQSMEKTFKEYLEKQATKDYMSLSEACNYIGVSYNTLMKFRTLGLKVIEIEGVKRVKKSDIDEFMDKYKF